jgi:hypothetical protein
VEAWDTGDLLEEAIGAAVTDAEGRFEIKVGDRTHARLVKAKAQVFFRVRRDEEEIADTREDIRWNPALPKDVAIPVGRPGDDTEGESYQVSGRVVTERGSAASAVMVVAVDRNLRGETTLGETTTDTTGSYRIVYRRAELGGKELADLEVRVVAIRDDTQTAVMSRSKVTYQAPKDHVVDLEVSLGDLERSSEHDRLIDDVSSLLGDIRLAEVDAEGVVYLANRAGWDPRLVAMAVQAERAAESGIPAAHYYAMFRTGVARDPAAAHRLTEKSLVEAVETAAKSGVITSNGELGQSVEIHRGMAEEAMRSFVPTGGASSLEDLLDIRLDEDEKRIFVDRLRVAEDDPDQIWAGLEEAGMSSEKVQALQLDAKLGYLTHYNADVIRRLVDNGVSNTADLVNAGLYEPEAWESLISGSTLNGMSAEAYASGLAAQVRLAHPTLVVADMVRQGKLDIDANGSASAVSDFLAAADRDHRIGSAPLMSWDGFSDLDIEAQQGALLVERLYQISPSDSSMAVLSDLGLHSARAVTRHTEDEFLTIHGESFPSMAEAAMVHRKATQVEAMVLNLATGYLTQRNLPPIHVLSGNPQAVGDLETIGEFPAKATLEALYDNLDFCACAHCNSVLGPAAYLVELLELLDLSDVPHAGSNPIDVLLGRRPDLQHILLSCENTNVVLPYIDLVNEVLEHYVVNGDLDDFQGHDTPPDATTADLLVDPLFVEATAYTTLADHVFPAPLPFDMPLEGLRLQFQTWGSTLPDALGLFSNPAASRRERLHLNASELSILTDTTFKELPEYFGEPAGTSIGDLNDAISNAKVFCRRIDVKYLELDRILKTRFVNPGIGIVPAFEVLDIGLDIVQSWLDGDISDQDISVQLAEDFDPAAFGGDVLAWLTDNQALLMGLITLSPTSDADPETDNCDFGDLELQLSHPDENLSALTDLEYHRLHRFVRIWRALQEVIDADVQLTDRLLTTFLPIAPADLTMGNLDDTLSTALAGLANFVAVLDYLDVPKKKRESWLELFDPGLDMDSRSKRLARLVRLGATDFANLVEITGIDPFADNMEADLPSLRDFIDTWMMLDESPLKVDDVDYLLRDNDPAGIRLPTLARTHTDIARIRTALAAVEATLAGPAEPDLTVARTYMAQAYDASLVDRFFGFLLGTSTYREPLVTVEEALADPIRAVAPAIDFDPFEDELVFTGTMSNSTRGDLVAAADALTLADVEVIDDQVALDAYVVDLKAAIDAVHAAGDADLTAFTADHPELAAVLTAALAADAAARPGIVLDGISPRIRGQLRGMAVRATLANLLRTEEPIVAALLSGADVLHAKGDPARDVMDDLLGLDATVQFDNDAVFDFLLVPATADDYLIYVQAPAGTQVTLDIDGDSSIPVTAIGPSGEVAAAAAVALVAESPVAVRLTLAGLPANGTATIRWRTESTVKSDVPNTRIIDGPAADAAAGSLRRLGKAVLLADKLGLTPRELVFIGGNAPDASGLLSDLAVGSPAAAAVPPMWAKLRAVLSFAEVKRVTETDADTWVDILETSALGDAAGQERVATIGSWRPADVADAVAFLGLAGDGFRELESLGRLHGMVQYAKDTDQTVSNLVAWAVPDPDAALLTAVKESVRSVLDPASWRETMQSVNDELRNLRRDALVAYILAHDPPSPTIETPDELYEHFLLDVQMDACMQTSRIRLALSTVQLFITRCLMNLEPDVSSDSIRQDRWAWMKRYRVWEANRKVFLWPENWLEPELRDIKSPFFRDLESELLKSDITRELAEDAFLSYLKKLDDVARLEVVGCYLQQKTPGDPDDDILHVIARSNGKTRQYWYRRFEYRTYWTPWEKVSLNIEGDLVIPTFWRNQLFLFWVTAVEKPRSGNQDAKGGPLANQTWAARSPVDVELTLNWGELYRGKWGSPKSTNMNKPLVIRGLGRYHPGSLLLFSRTEKPPASSERLIFSVIYYHGSDVKAFKVVFTSKNASPIAFEDDPDNELVRDVALFYKRLYWDPQNNSILDFNSLDIPRTHLTVRIDQPDNAWADTVDQKLLTKTSGFNGWNVHTAMHPTENQWETPFFYADEHSTFHVQGHETYRNFSLVDVYLPPEGVLMKTEFVDLYEETVVDPLDPIWDPPWKHLVNVNIKTVLGEDVSFELDGKSFDAIGLME